ncbi:MAG: 4Fe-4S dicluster domain-containing protein [Nitrospiraceae bacterium]|nr:MAG: 4Fe-4S dicluster domain-containing protein [Nitrospiraceae bacterium]
MKFPKLDTENLKKENSAQVPMIERREFLRMGLIITGVFAGGTILSAVPHMNKVFASSRETAGKYPYKPHYSMVIRQDRCIDCERCLEACIITNDVPDYGYRTAILQREVPDAVGQKREFIPVLCNQCNNPPCVRACPVKATYKDKQTGIVMMDYTKCIGCKVCVMACPYNARYFNEERHSIDKCNFCFDTRLSKGESLTACAAACPAGVRVFGDLSDPGSNVYGLVHQIEKPVWVLRPEVGAKPNVFYMKG